MSIGDSRTVLDLDKDRLDWWIKPPISFVVCCLFCAIAPLLVMPANNMESLLGILYPIEYHPTLTVRNKSDCGRIA